MLSGKVLAGGLFCWELLPLTGVVVVVDDDIALFWTDKLFVEGLLGTTVSGLAPVRCSSTTCLSFGNWFELIVTGAGADFRAKVVTAIGGGADLRAKMFAVAAGI